MVAPVTMVAHDGSKFEAHPRLTVTGCGPQVSVTAARATSHGVTVTVNTSERGQLTLGGSGLRTLVKRKLAAGRHTLALAFTRAGRSAAHAHRKIRIDARLVVGKARANSHRKVVL